MVEPSQAPRAHDVISFGPFSLFAAERLVKKGDKPLQVGGRALDILIALVDRAGEVVSQRDLVERVWPNINVEEGTLRVHIAGLRKALGDGSDGARYIANIPGRGYSFVAPVTRSTDHLSPPLNGPTEADHRRTLPPRPTHMVGRDEAVAALGEQIIKRRLVSIVGAGGIGKTTVAVAVGHHLSDHFDGAVFFVDLSAVTDPELVLTTIGSTLGIMLRTKEPLSSLVAFLENKKLLLILDNCEHVIERTAAMAERVIEAASEMRILTTSREALQVNGEYVHLLYPLECPPEDANLNMAEALRYPAAKLFIERAIASGYSAEIPDADVPTIARICRRLDGLAFAIELVASRAGAYGIRGIAELLDHRFKLLWQSRRTALPRHQTLNALIDWSYNLLSEFEKEVLAKLSVFVGEFTLDAACAAISDAESEWSNIADAIVGLVSKSFISTSLVSGRTYYRLLETTREYSAARLDERGETDLMGRRHALTFSELVRRDERIRSTFGHFDLSEYAQHISNVRAALEWSLGNRRDIEVGVQLAVWSAPLFIELSLLEECSRWSERALSMLREVKEGAGHELLLQSAFALSSMFAKGSTDQVRSAIERGLVLAEASNEKQQELQLLTGLHIFLIRTGRIQESLAVAERGREVAKAAQVPAGLVMMETVLGISNHLLGNQAAAQSHLESSLTQAMEVGAFNASFFGFVPPSLAIVPLARTLWLRGLADEAMRTAQKAIDEADSRHHPVALSYALAYGSSVFIWTGERQRAGALVERLIAYSRQHSLDPHQAVGMALKGELALLGDDLKAGVSLLRTALEALGAIRHNVYSTGYMAALAEGLRRSGDAEGALSVINGAIARGDSSGEGIYLPELLRTKAEILVSLPRADRDKAVDCLKQALLVAREQSALAWELRSATTLARLLAETGQRSDGRQVVAGVYDRFVEGFETTDLRAARQIIRDLL